LDGTVITRAMETGAAKLSRFPTGKNPAMSVVTFEPFNSRAMSAGDRAKFDALVWGRIDILDLDESVAEWIPAVRAGRDIPSREAVVAATALLHDRTLVTYNVKAFEGVPGLRVWDAGLASV
jgi:predicted nucleic acid-binding protein